MSWLAATLYLLGGVAFYNGTRILLGNADVAEARLMATLIWPFIIAWSIVISSTELSSDLYAKFRALRARLDAKEKESESRLQGHNR